MAYFTEKRFVFDKNDRIAIVFTEMLDNIYIYIYISWDVRSNANALFGTSLLLGGTRDAYHSRHRQEAHHCPVELCR